MQRKHFFWLCLLAALRCNAAIYQWTDSTGTVQFGDRPPPERVEVIERRDLETRATAAPSQPLPPRVPVHAKPRNHKPRKIAHKVARTTKREQARHHCDQIRRRIAATQSQLRAGYSARRGIKLTQRLRADRDTLYHDCRY